MFKGNLGELLRLLLGLIHQGLIIEILQLHSTHFFDNFIHGPQEDHPFLASYNSFFVLVLFAILTSLANSG
jgi:hypothetical protein